MFLWDLTMLPWKASYSSLLKAYIVLKKDFRVLWGRLPPPLRV